MQDGGAPHLSRPPARSPLPYGVRASRPLVGVLTLLALSWCLRAADLAEAQRSFRRGEYAEALMAAEKALADSPEDAEAWHQLRIEGLLVLGRYPDAQSAAEKALDAIPRSVALRWTARAALSRVGQTTRAAELTAEIPGLAANRPWAYRNPPDLIAIGRAFLAAGADPKEVLDRIFNPVRKAAPDFREVYLATGELALDKGDFALAARQFDQALARFPDDPDLHAGRARAFSPSNREEMAKSLEAALKINPRHLPSLLLLADHRIDAEDYEGADKALDEIRAVNPVHPEAWTYAAVIAHLRHDPVAEARARGAAREFWPSDPAVPHLLGRKLSQKYRFAEGAALQREALAFDPGFLPAKAQLASDLLRLGEDAAGWELIQEVHARDAYDVTAYNLVTLHDALEDFVTLTNEHFRVRMQSREAAIYGARVLDLLQRAHTTLSGKYGLTPVSPTVVEIFPQPKDFEVRTFGMPDNPGYLGVCFGRVITANSPASSRGKAVNWESVLWHEFCHVITLQLTANRMPRWLSEGISVYEERLANPAWGERLNPRYREMILGDDLTPIARLSAAFLTPKSPLHLQFAYYESSLVVEFLVENYGLPRLRRILDDLREGVFINTAIENHIAPFDTLEKDFAEFARARALALGPELDWTPPSPGRRPNPLAAILPPASPATNNFWQLMAQAQRQINDRQWSEALPLLESLIRAYPAQTGPDSAHALLVRVHRTLDQPDAEEAALARWAAVDAGATEAYARLMDLASAREAWPIVRENAERYLAVNPLVPLPYRYLAAVHERHGDPLAAIRAYQTLLQLDPSNPADAHFQLARLLRPTDAAAARRHLLQSLEGAPRQRAALQLLLEWDPPATPPVAR